MKKPLLFSQNLDGVIVSGTFRKSAIKNKDFDGDLVIDVASDEFDVNEETQNVQRVMSEGNIVTFGANANQFVIGYVKAADCQDLFDQVCAVMDYSLVSL